MDAEHAGERCRRDPQPEEWFFFIPRREREARGGRPNRLTTDGYWKASGSPGWVYSSDEGHRIIGLKRTMVFYRGRARNRRSGPGTKTEWKMNEYVAVDLADQPAFFSPAAAVTVSTCSFY